MSIFEAIGYAFVIGTSCLGTLVLARAAYKGLDRELFAAQQWYQQEGHYKSIGEDRVVLDHHEMNAMRSKLEVE